MRHKNRSAILFLAAVLLAAPAAGEPEPSHDGPSTVRVDAEGRVETAPDIVSLTVRVVTEDPRSAKAAEDNAGTTRSVIAALRRTMGDDVELQTTGYSVTPRFEPFKPNTERKLIGYQVRNSVVLRTDDLKGIGRAIDAATGAGANEIDSLRFELSDDFALRLQALSEATRRARAKADAIAAALGKKVSRVIAVEESSGFASPLRMEARLTAKAATPVEVGDLEVRARVSMQVALQD